MDTFAWAEEVLKKLKAEFGNRLRFVGLQGSRARGDAHEGNEARIIEIGRDWEAHRPADDAKRRELVDLLLRWSEGVMIR